jgi:mRNA-degrading endonuclease YafQ of YafQ-DinJ toxin-antitoxin module
MQVQTHKRYDKMWSELDSNQQEQEQEQVLGALKLFITNQNMGELRIHQLRGKYYPQYSLTAAEDLRVHFLRVRKNRVVLVMVGTHDQLYG